MTIAPRTSMHREAHSMTPRTAATVSLLPGMFPPVAYLPGHASVGLWHKPPALEALLVVVAVAVAVALGQLKWVARHFLVRDKAQKVGQAVEARPPLVVGADDVPRGFVR